MLKIGNSGIKRKPFIVTEAGYLPLPNGDKMYIPKYYLFNNASIPRPLKWLHDTFKIDVLNYKKKAFCGHDFLYNFKGYLKKDKFEITPVDRPFADDAMAYIMDTELEPEIKTKIYFFFVRLCGWLFWGKI